MARKVRGCKREEEADSRKDRTVPEVQQQLKMVQWPTVVGACWWLSDTSITRTRPTNVGANLFYPSKSRVFPSSPGVFPAMTDQRLPPHTMPSSDSGDEGLNLFADPPDFY
ncbi:hypothetical protein V498_05044, partial [Pseudogymnoascus sp. VKM F-4517 (FW-2822)]